MSTEATLIAVAVAVYLLDCVVLLERGQALWSPGALSFGSIHYQIRGKAVAMLNPLTPFVPVHRTLPLFSTADAEKLSTAVRALAPVATMSALQFVLVFAVLPYCLYRAPGMPFLVSLLVAYASAVAMLGLILWRLRRAGLPTRPLFGLGFAWLACLPLSANAQRKAGLAFDVALDAHQAIRVLPARARERARHDLDIQVVEAMQELEVGDERHQRLASFRRGLIAEAGHGRV